MYPRLHSIVVLFVSFANQWRLLPANGVFFNPTLLVNVVCQCCLSMLSVNGFYQYCVPTGPVNGFCLNCLSMLSFNVVGQWRLPMSVNVVCLSLVSVNGVCLPHVLCTWQQFSCLAKTWFCHWVKFTEFLINNPIWKEIRPKHTSETS